MSDSTEEQNRGGNGTFDDAIAHYFSTIDQRDSVSISRLVAAFPQHRDELLQFFDAEKQLARHLPATAKEGNFFLRQPDQIGRFRIQEKIGVGAFGVVYLACDDSLKRLVALKIPLPQVIGDRESRRRFEAEAAAAARLVHPGIVAVYEANFEGTTPYIASAYCTGPDLGRWLEQHPEPVPWREAATFMAQLADAVAFAHRAQVFHRDLKPSNVMLNPVENEDGGASLRDFSPQLTDFGLAKCALFNDRQTRSSMILGTPLYMAPEQLESARSQWPVQSDIYSLGCILYELLTRQLPVMGDTYVAVLEQLRDVRPVSIQKHAADVPTNLATVCEKCLEKDPQVRYGSVEELADDLRACVEGRPISASKASLLARLRFWSTRPQRIYEAGLYALCVQSLLAVWFITAVLGAFSTGLVDADAMPRLMFELFAINGLVHLPLAFIGWQTLHRKRWAISAGLILCTVNIAIPIVFISLSIPPFLADIYAKVDSSGYLAFAICSLVFLAEVGQLLLYSAAWIALRHKVVNAT
jgi:tRNA A-37 threonylcarbamoyl transferase component Bud32